MPSSTVQQSVLADRLASGLMFQMVAIVTSVAIKVALVTVSTSDAAVDACDKVGTGELSITSMGPIATPVWSRMS